MRQLRETVGRVQYGPRAFHQDASQAMKGDIVRALIETITNSDDAYGDASGKIRIEVEHRHGPWTVITRDRAHGMSAGRMKEAIEGLGGRTSGFEAGEDVRGNLGRGAKDLAAFGTVEFESICDGRYGRMTLEETGDTRLTDRKATAEDRKALGIKSSGSGTVVTMHARDNIRCPRHETLKEKLSKHFQLRDILADPRREVTLVDSNSGTSDVLRSPSYPSLPVAYTAELPIEGYEAATASVSIYRNPERFDDPPSDPGRPGGLLIKGRRAIYENTYFRFENNAHAGWFSGVVECRFIDDLANEYDRRLIAREPQEAANNQPIITRSRDGLEHNHPFYRALAAAVEVPLGELIDAEEQRARGEGVHESARLRRLLDALGRDLARLIDEDLRAIDDEGLPPEANGQAEVPPLKVVPEQVVAYIGEDKTVSVIARADLAAEEAQAEVEPGGVVELIDGPTILLAPHRRRPDLLTGQIHVRPLVADQGTFLTVMCGEHSAVALIETRPEAEVVEVEVVPPEELEFERDSYRLTWTKRKKLKIVAPVEAVDSNGKSLRVTSSDPGVVVLGGGATPMILDDEVEFYVATVQVEARAFGAKAVLRAELGEASATCNAVITRDEEAPNLHIRFVDEEAGNSRAVVVTEDGQRVMKVMGRHPAMTRYLGPAPEFPHQERPLTQAILAEILAGEATRMVMEKKYPFGQADDLDAAAMYAEHMRYMKKYLARCHRQLVPDSVVE